MSLAGKEIYHHQIMTSISLRARNPDKIHKMKLTNLQTHHSALATSQNNYQKLLYLSYQALP